jgi:hypothetical protein
MRKKRSIARSRTASLKGWRTRQRMQDARWDDVYAYVEARQAEPPVDPDQNWPAYMRRALPNPWLSQ